MKLVLLPGLDGTGVLFRPLLAALAPSIKPVVITYPTQEPLGYDQLLSIAMRSLPQDEPYILLGESFGGPLSIRIAAMQPERLRGLILCGSFVTCPVENVPSWLAYAVQPLQFRTFPFFLWLQRAMGLYETEEHATLAREAIGQVASSVLAHRVREIIGVDVTTELASCSIPMLYMQGKRDRIVGSANLHRITKIKSRIRTVQIDCGHMILKTRPIEAARIIEEFAQRI